MRADTVESRRRLYLLARLIIARHYRQELTLAGVARALASSPRQLQRAFEQFGHSSFREDLLARRLAVGAQLLLAKHEVPVADVARLVGYRQGSHFARAFRRHYGLAPASYRESGLRPAVGAGAGDECSASPQAPCGHRRPGRLAWDACE
jgi:two-component system response regulator YesN